MNYKHGLREVKYQYGLHDTEINRIKIAEEGIVLEFDNGVYLLADSGAETTLSKKCYLELKINSFDRQKMYEHINIQLIHKKKIKEIEYREFEEMLAQSSIDVYLDYYCPFADSLLIKGFMKQGEIEFAVTEISELTFVFED